MITQKRLHEQLTYNHLTGIFTNIQAGKIAGSDHDGYIRIGIDCNQYLAHHLAWLSYYGVFPENDIDHKDQVRHHNWILNLREASKMCNARNTGNKCTNTSGVKGVYWNTKEQKWKSTIGINFKIKGLGTYSDFEEAVCARLAGEQCLNWEGCDNNNPAYQYVKEMLKC